MAIEVKMCRQPLGLQVQSLMGWASRLLHQLVNFLSRRKKVVKETNGLRFRTVGTGDEGVGVKC